MVVTVDDSGWARADRQFFPDRPGHIEIEVTAHQKRAQHVCFQSDHTATEQAQIPWFEESPLKLVRNDNMLAIKLLSQPHWRRRLVQAAKNIGLAGPSADVTRSSKSAVSEILVNAQNAGSLRKLLRTLLKNSKTSAVQMELEQTFGAYASLIYSDQPWPARPQPSLTPPSTPVNGQPMPNVGALAELLRALFTPDELERLTAEHWPEFASSIPWKESASEVSFKVGQALQRHGKISPNLFEILCTVRPERIDEIETVRNRLI